MPFTVRVKMSFLTGLLLAATVSGCGSAQQAAVEATAVRFYAAVQGGDGAGACDLLAPRTKSELEQSAGKGCDKAILEEDIPTVGTPKATQVFGTSGRVDFGNEKAFMARFQGGWKLMAAACRQQRPAQPYDCQVSGG
jgi:hypothetical protein